MKPLDDVLAWCSGHIPHVTSRSHLFLYRLTGKRFGSRLPGYCILWLTTTGRKTGKQRTKPLLYITDGSDYVILASNDGADTPPQWYLNLLHQSQATIEVNRSKIPVIARTADAPERARLWPVALKTYPLYEVVARRTQREIPVVILRHVASQ